MSARQRLLAATLIVLSSLLSPIAGSAPAVATPLIGGHWAHDGLAHSQIYFVDFTGVNWPVDVSTYKWNEAQGVDSYYVSSCPASYLHCVNVVEYSSYDGYYGYVYYIPYDNAGHYTTTNTVHLNNQLTVSPEQRRSTTCQEQGHVLGLDHSTAADTCMLANTNPSFPQYPNADDFGTLQALYAHPN